MIIVCFFILSIIVYKIIPQKQQNLSVVLVSFLMATIAFFMTEVNHYDLISHRGLYETLQEGGISSAFTYSSIDRSPLFIWLVYVLTYLGDSRYTSAVPTFIGYFIVVYLLVQTSKGYKVNKQTQTLLLLFLLFIIPWQDFSAGVRGALSYSLCCLGIFCELYKGQRLFGLFLYIFPIFIHQSSIIFLVIRCLAYLIEKQPSLRKIIYFLCLLAGSMTEFLGPLIEGLANISGLRILAIVSNSFNTYAIEGKDIYEVSIVVLRVLAVLLIYYATLGFSKSYMVKKSDRSIYSMYTMLMLFSIGFIWQYDIVCRYTVACMIFSPLILYRCNKKYIAFMVVFSIVTLIKYYGSYYSKWEFLFQ